MRASVAGIPQDKQVARHGIKHGVNWHAGISAAQDGSMGSLTMVHQGLPVEHTENLKNQLYTPTCQAASPNK